MARTSTVYVTVTMHMVDSSAAKALSALRARHTPSKQVYSQAALERDISYLQNCSKSLQRPTSENPVRIRQNKKKDSSENPKIFRLRRRQRRAQELVCTPASHRDRVPSPASSLGSCILVLGSGAEAGRQRLLVCSRRLARPLRAVHMLHVARRCSLKRRNAQPPSSQAASAASLPIELPATRPNVPTVLPQLSLPSRASGSATRQSATGASREQSRPPRGAERRDRAPPGWGVSCVCECVRARVRARLRARCARVLCVGASRRAAAVQVWPQCRCHTAVGSALTP